MRHSEAPQSAMGAKRCGKDGLRGRVSRLEQDGRGASATARIDLGSYHLGNCTIGKLPLGKLSLGKSWENGFEKVPNTPEYSPEQDSPDFKFHRCIVQTDCLCKECCSNSGFLQIHQFNIKH